MKHWKKICVCSALVLCMSLMGLMFFLLLQKDQMSIDAENVAGGAERMSSYYIGMSTQEDAAAMLREFADVIYTYDTAERMFYEGAERYLTEPAYREFIPFLEDGKNSEDDTEEPIRICSELIEAEPYFYFTECGAEAIMVSRFTLSGKGRGQLTQCLSLTLEESGGRWCVTSCRVLWTFEQ